MGHAEHIAFRGFQWKEDRNPVPSVPAPFHLASLIFKWPGLSFADRIRVAAALNS